ncbi:MAG TPA: transcription antitermination factor NusB [Rhizomicrobium sp.]|jgi:N utilization substance protein B
MVEREHDPPNPRAERRAARLAAVQALYQMELTGKGSETVAQEFLEHPLGDEPSAPDEHLFRSILAGVPHRQSEIDRAIASCLSAKWRLERIDSILRAILRAAAFEILARPDIPARVAIDEYIEIAHRFCAAEECRFVNAALDRLARGARPAEFAGSPSDERPDS